MTGRERVRLQGERALRQCSRNHKLSPRVGLSGIVYAREHLPVLLPSTPNAPKSSLRQRFEP